ncbi:hypothetical protein F4821DRAFT_237848 [Hypoxylon rubiginosum]|uniref:Uncharacterized protein n=1 Tax=Hypoxylon rubiginosum TaxID=110542 RepID=A0ACC0D278_9PEZI|nr:hypothetical protein F4821DRAFT_237848 [Hypoxylon rubiginosum]
MAPFLPASVSNGDSIGHILARELEHLRPTRTLPDAITKVLTARQEGTTTVVAVNSGDQHTLSGGAIAGIVIGSIVGFLLILWLIRCCTNWGKPNAWGNNFEPEHEKPPTHHHNGHSTRYARETHGHRSHSRHSHRSPRRTSVVSVTRPVYVEQPSRSRGRSPRAPPAAYYNDGLRRSSDARRSSDGRRYSRGH